MKSILLLSFINKDQIYLALDKISETLNIKKSQIFVFKIQDTEELIVTYNLNPNYTNIKFNSIWPNTISIHRKKQTNTLYSLNAMNELIKKKNGGVFKKEYALHWEDFKNSLMIIKNGKLKILKIQLVKINQ